MARLDISPEVLIWARERADIPRDALERRFKGYADWESGDSGPTFPQLEKLGGLLHLPIGMFFLPAPPEEQLPLPDFRRIADVERRRPSTELIDTIQTCQARQSWYREYVVGLGTPPLEFCGSATPSSDVVTTAENIRTVIGLEVRRRSEASTWTEFLRQFVQLAQEAGILVMINGVVGNNTSRTLDPREFRGFAIADKYAPLIFINGADTKAAQIFTLAHEMAHIWLGESGVSHAGIEVLSHQNKIERWCNAVAAEVLVPLAELRRIELSASLNDAISTIARRFRVSTLVALRRLLDLGKITVTEFNAAYVAELERLIRLDRKSSSGGDFYNTMNVRVGRHFARAVLSSAIEGRTLMGEAMALLSINKTDTLRREARELGLAL